MDLNKIIFPAPSSNYTPFTLDKLIWIPRTRFFSMKSLVKSMDSFENCFFESRTTRRQESSPKQDYIHIPCHYQSYSEDHSRIVLYFHGNAEDIGYASTFTRKLAIGLKADVLAVEYPGYGVYEGTPSAKTILEDAEIVFDFLTAEVGVKPENIIILGRSIGSGPATHLAANRKPGALVLMSPYTSIKAVVKSIAGQLVSMLFAERFSNIDEISKVECPCFFIHGKKDRIIPWEHSQELFVRCKGTAAFNLSETMSHNNFRINADIVNPIKKFLREKLDAISKDSKAALPEFVFKVPLRKYIHKNQDITAKLVDNIVCEP